MPTWGLGFSFLFPPQTLYLCDLINVHEDTGKWARLLTRINERALETILLCFSIIYLDYSVFLAVNRLSSFAVLSNIILPLKHTGWLKGLPCPFCYETCFHKFFFLHIYFNVNIFCRVFCFIKQFLFFKKKKCDPGVIGTAFTVAHSIIMPECTRAASSCRMCL